MTAALAVGRSPGVEFKPTRGATPRVAETLRADPDRRYPAISDLDQVTN